MTTPRPQLSGHPRRQPARPGATEPDQGAGPDGPDRLEPGLCRPELPILPPHLRQPLGPRPLPDVVAVRRLPLPDSAPPYDDQPARPQAATTGTRKAAGTGAASGTGTADLRPGQPGPERAGSGAGQPVPARAGQPGLAPPPGAWPSQFAQVLAEALAGARPPQQLTSWTTERARNRIRQLGPLLQAGPGPRVRRVVSCSPAGDVVELAVIVSVGPAVRALAVRLERAGPLPRGRAWLCTDIEAA